MTGGAGFIGSSLCESLVLRGDEVTVIDNFTSGSNSNLAWAVGFRNSFAVVRCDVKSQPEIERLVRSLDTVFHFAANPEVRLDKSEPKTCFEENVAATQVVLEAARKSSVRSLIFASSSTVYGEARVQPTPEEYCLSAPISIYGACKLASEALISGYAKTYGFNATILRFANVIGPRSNHGVVPDFVRKLKADPNALEILGDGLQTKSYLYIDDCVSAITLAEKSASGLTVYNVGSKDQIDVKQVAAIVSKVMGLTPRYKFTGGIDGGRGWKGDVTNMILDIRKMQSLGWQPKHSSAEAVLMTAKQLQNWNAVGRGTLSS